MKIIKNLTLSQVGVIILSLFISIIVLFNIPGNNLSWDVFGYYLYLPMTFIYHDLGMKNIDVVYSIIEKYQSTGTFYQASQIDGNLWVNKYSMGMAILYLPSFLIGHLFAWISGFPTDGFSKPYMLANLLGSLIYSIAGIYFLRKILIKYFSEKITFIVMILIILSTNYYHNSCFNNNMSHNYLFTLYSMMIFYVIRWHDTYKIKYIIGIAIISGLAVLSRPSEIVCLTIPALWGVYDKNSLINKIKLILKYWQQMLLFAIIIFLIGIPQFIYWKWITGKYLYMSYNNPGEGFEFMHPYIKEVLFSFRKGWYIYTPLMLFATFGFYRLYKIKKEIFWALFVFFILNIYLVSSWSCWWYADSFGQRALVQSMVIMAIPLGFYIHNVFAGTLFKRIIIIPIFLFFIFLNFFQTWQINNGILATSRMTSAYYFKTFLKTSIEEEDQKLLLVSRAYDGIEKMPDVSEFNHTNLAIFNYDDKNEDFKDFIDSTVKYSGKYSLKLDSNRKFSPAYKKSFKALTEKEYAWIKVTAYVYPTVNFISNPASLVITFRHKEYNYKYYTLDLEKQNLNVGEWNRISAVYMTPEVRNQKDEINIYFWLRENKPFYVDDLSIDLYEPKGYTEKNSVEKKSIKKDVNYYILQIKSDSIWYENVKHKAKEKNISINEMLKLDAQYMVEHQNDK